MKKKGRRYAPPPPGSLLVDQHKLHLLPTSREGKYKANSAIDTFGVRLGDVLQAAIIFVGSTLHFDIRSFAAVSLVMTVVWIFVAVLLYPQPQHSNRTPQLRVLWDVRLYFSDQLSQCRKAPVTCPRSPSIPEYRPSLIVWLPASKRQLPLKMKTRNIRVSLSILDAARNDGGQLLRDVRTLPGDQFGASINRSWAFISTALRE